MAMKKLSVGFHNAALVSIIFAITLGYSGPGYNLHWLSLSILILTTCLAVLIARLDLLRLQIAWGWVPVAMATYLGWLFIAPFVSTYPNATSTTAMGLASLPLMFFARLLSPDDSSRDWQHPLWRALMFFSLVLALWGIVDFVVFDQRSHASLLDPNAYAALINLFLLASAYLYLTVHHAKWTFRSPRLFLVFITFLTLAQAMSISRGALLAFLAVLPALFWLSRKHSAFRSRALSLLLVLISIHVLVNLMPANDRTGLHALLLTPTQYVAGDSPTRERLLLWKSTLKMIGDSNLLIGDGLGTFKIYYPPYRDENETSAGNFAHNDYLQAVQEGGVIQLTFFVGLAVFAPMWMLLKIRQRSATAYLSKNPEIAIGLLIGIVCISLHALVNFIHFVGPISLLTGLYLAEAWKTVQPRRSFQFPHSVLLRVKPGFVRGLVILVLAVPTAVLVLDGIIFKLFGTNEAIHARLEPGARFTILNLALALRPENPVPRIMLIRALISAAEQSNSPDDRDMLVNQAQRETLLLSRNAPALAIGQHYFRGKIRALKGTRDDLVLARDDLERAVKLVPPATRMRLELVKVYRRLGQEADAYAAVREARKWLNLEVDYHSLAAFAREAESVSQHHGDRDETKFWSWIRARLTMLGFPG